MKKIIVEINNKEKMKAVRRFLYTEEGGRIGLLYVLGYPRLKTFRLSLGSHITVDGADDEYARYLIFRISQIDKNKVFGGSRDGR